MIKHYHNRQANYTDQYTIEYREGDDSFTMWCTQSPRDPFKKGPHEHHLQTDGKLCQRPGYESQTFEEAEAFAHWWMNRYSIYVRTGHFPMTRESVEVPD